VVRSTLLELAKMDKLVDFKNAEEEAVTKSSKETSSKRFDSQTKISFQSNTTTTVSTSPAPVGPIRSKC
jgi:hypothetical protein